jgi:hypothetical protein
LEVKVHVDLITIRAGRSCHSIAWSSGRLELQSAHHDSELRAELFHYSGAVATSARFRYPGLDRSRFLTGCSAHGLTVLVDVLRHVVVLDARGELVAIFCVSRNALGAWLPDGSRMGAASLLGRPATPDAPERFARALQAACARGRERHP